jgi:membrane fusion protein, multidrug efflux system
VSKRKRISIAFWVCAAACLLIGFLGWLFHFRHFVYTDDCYVQGNLVYITPLHGGFVTSIHTDDSFLVKKGQLLVTLDETDAKIALSKASENLAQVVRNVCESFHQVFVYQAEIDLKKAELIRDAQDALHRKEVFRQQGVSIEDYEHSIAALHASYASLEMSTALYRRSLAAVQNSSIRNHPLVLAAADQLRDAWVQLYRCKIYSPVDGLAAQRTIQVGMWIGAGQPLLSVIPLNQIWINANYKETQIRPMRLGQSVEIKADLWGGSHRFHGTIVGLPGGAGNAFSLLPPENLSGNWIKIVQRLPVRVALDPQEVLEWPLRVGLTCTARVDIRDQTGVLVPDTTAGSPLYRTEIFACEECGDEKLVEETILANLDPTLLLYAERPLNPPPLIVALPSLLEEALRQDSLLRQEVTDQIE